jgi:peptide deformylase
MAVRPVILYPDTRLKQLCPAVNDVNDDLRAVVQDLIETMDAGPPRTVGIAAPQIGEMTRVAVVDVSRNPKYPSHHGLLVLINPVIVAQQGEQLFREGCLSIPQFTANIRRAQAVTVEALDQAGTSFQIEAEGFEAVVLQHEIDHLDGILFLDRVSNVKSDLFARKEKTK